MRQVSESLLFVIGLWLYPHAQKIQKNRIGLGDSHFY